MYNNAVFTPEDWHGIQEIARSRKKDDPLKVGRFGIGFNSVYHITGMVSGLSVLILKIIIVYWVNFRGEAVLKGICPRFCQWQEVCQ